MSFFGVLNIEESVGSRFCILDIEIWILWT